VTKSTDIFTIYDVQCTMYESARILLCRRCRFYRKSTAQFGELINKFLFIIGASPKKACKSTAFFSYTQIFLRFFVFFYVFVVKTRVLHAPDSFLFSLPLQLLRRHLYSRRLFCYTPCCSNTSPFAARCRHFSSALC